MDKMVVQGGIPLNGKVQVSGAKNAALKLLFASLLAEGEHYFHNVPHLKDIDSTIELLATLGAQVEWVPRSPSVLRVSVGQAPSLEAHYDLVRKMRAGILCLGPLLAKYGQAVVSLPGGCAIGTRPIDLHLEGLRALGAEISVQEGYVKARATSPSKRLQGANFLFETSTVGGTENLIMAAALAEGVTTLENAAKEPEIINLVDYLNKMGAKISGQGTSVITIEGVDVLRPAEHTVMSDRIEAGTLLIAGAITGGEVTVGPIHPEHLEALLIKLQEAGFSISITGTSTESLSPSPEGGGFITLKGNQGKGGRSGISGSSGNFRAVDITTHPYPLYPTDLQAQFMALMCLAEGTSVITEMVFENRFMHVQELVRMGADITPKTRVAVVRGRPGQLSGAPVMATDLRASAALVLGGLAAQGETVIHRIYHLDRGYENLEAKLTSLGGKIKRL